MSIDSLTRPSWRWYRLVRPPPRLATLTKVAARLTLAQKFAVLCLVILVAGALVLGRLVATEIRAKVMQRTSSTAALYVESVVSPHVQELSSASTISPQNVAALDAVVENPAFREKIVSVKIWLPGGAVAYATDERLTGQAFPNNEELQMAVRGSIRTELSSLEDAENVFERAAWPRLLETYVPVREHGTGQIIAVAEFYQDPSDLLAEISSSQRRAWMIVGFATVGMYLALSTLVAGGSRTITRQNRHLERTVKELTSLQSVTDSALSSLSLDAFLATLLVRAIEATRSDAGMVLLADGGPGLTARAIQGMSPPRRRVDAGESPFLQELLETRRAVDSHAQADGDQDRYLTGLGLASALGVPLLGHDEVVGVAFVGTRAHHEYSDDDLRLLRVLSERVALFIQNAALQERVFRAASAKAETDERLMSRIAHDLHDGPAQNMAVSLLRLEAVRNAVARRDWSSTADKDLDLIHMALDTSLKELRTLSAGLSLPELATLSLQSSVEAAVRQHEQLTGSHVVLDMRGLPVDVHLARKIAVFRLLQEALNNACHHGGTTEQTVTIRRLGRALLVEVADRGSGFDVEATGRQQHGGGLGLPGMRERIELLGGTLTIISKVGEGTRVIASVPIDQGA